MPSVPPTRPDARAPATRCFSVFAVGFMVHSSTWVDDGHARCDAIGAEDRRVPRDGGFARGGGRIGPRLWRGDRWISACGPSRGGGRGRGVLPRLREALARPAYVPAAVVAAHLALPAGLERRARLPERAGANTDPCAAHHGDLRDRCRDRRESAAVREELIHGCLREAAPKPRSAGADPAHAAPACRHVLERDRRSRRQQTRRPAQTLRAPQSAAPGAGRRRRSSPPVGPGLRRSRTRLCPLHRGRALLDANQWPSTSERCGVTFAATSRNRSAPVPPRASGVPVRRGSVSAMAHLELHTLTKRYGDVVSV